MNAIEFVKKYGINEAKRYSKMIGLSIVEGVSVKDLKQIVDAWELVEEKGGLISIKKYLKFLQSSVDMGLYHGLDDVNYETEIPLISKAINLVEQCK